jgi:hypothetical protein
MDTKENYLFSSRLTMAEEEVVAAVVVTTQMTPIGDQMMGEALKEWVSKKSLTTERLQVDRVCVRSLVTSCFTGVLRQTFRYI